MNFLRAGVLPYFMLRLNLLVTLLNWWSPVTPTVLLLVLASAASIAPMAGYLVLTGHLGAGYLVWNLILAWMPLGFTLLAMKLFRRGDRQGLRFWVVTAAWLVFFPNAPYIFTDLVHLHTWHREHYWLAWAVILMCSITGLVVGFVSLYLMQSLVTQMTGRVRGWLFVAFVSGLSGVGIYLGRFVRLNSWDILTNPLDVLRSVHHFAGSSAAETTGPMFAVMVGFFLFTAYVALYALTHLPANLVEHRKQAL